MSSIRNKAIMEASMMEGDVTSVLTPLEPQFNFEALYGKDVFSLNAMRQRLPQNIYKAMDSVINRGERLTEEVANVVANAMKDWAVEHGATHYAHWFQPMSGVTAEKHDAFFMPTPDGHLINKFSGKMLICGEPDASSFPSGGIRSTFEARGYTAWDPTVPAFLLPGKYGHTLHIPTVFYSYTGEALDRKIPLLRSVDAISKSAVRVLRLFGDDKVEFVRPMAGIEQEYFLVDSRLAALRPDLLLTGRTLLGAPSAKGQEMEDHYFGATPKRVMAFMQDVETRLFALGIPVHTRHNEVAPAQFELAPLYEEANLATDHNMLIMNMLKVTASEHGFVCLLHEKPFAGVNGSGKHNNWSLCDSEGNNLIDPGETPLQNARFLVFLAALIKAVHEHSDVLRLGTVGAGNDHRLGANEAPPAITSIYLGDLLTEVLETIIAGGDSLSTMQKGIEIGVSSLPVLPRDLSDRNRTSPFAFTGNKFEFRAVGSSQSVSPINFALNSIVSCALDEISDEIEAIMNTGKTIQEALQEILPKVFREHMAVVFNGNGYSKEWHEEAEKRGLLNLQNTVSGLKRFTHPSVVEVFKRANVFTEKEIHARQEIFLEAYAKTITIEGQVTLSMVKERVIPVVQRAQIQAAKLVKSTADLIGDAAMEQKAFMYIRDNHINLCTSVDKLADALANIPHDETAEYAEYALNEIIPAMDACRKYSDALEQVIDDSEWTLPKYHELLWIH